MLTLDETTLFYFSLTNTSSGGKRFNSLITDWVNKVDQRPSESSRPNVKVNSKPGSSRSLAPGAPGLASKPASTKSSNPSALTKDITITSPVEQDECKAGDEDGFGSFVDEDETQGPEREAAVMSPPKGKRRLSSSVSLSCFRVLRL
jgi:hypothetical protein